MAMDKRLRPLFWPAVGLVVLLGLVLGASVVASSDPVTMDIAKRLTPPSAGHPLGRDEFGRDIWSRLVHGGKISLLVAITSAAIAAVIGTAMGMIGGYFRGLSETLTLRLADLVMCFPPILLALLLVTLLGPGVATLIGVLSVLYTPGFARVAYGETLTIRSQEFVDASRALGGSSARIICRTVLPNIAGPVVIQFSLGVAAAIVIESGLSFLGLGVVPPDPSWGLMIRGARTFMTQSPMTLFYPCAALVGTIFVINQLCDALRDVLDPKGSAASFRSLLVGAAAGQSESPAHAPTEDTLISIRDLSVSIGGVPATESVSFQIARGETVAIVGESGSGKSLTSLAILQLLPPAAHIASGSMEFTGKDGKKRDLVVATRGEMQSLRGAEIAMVFQEPMTSLNPVYTVGEQIAETLRQGTGLSKQAAQIQAVHMLRKVGMPDPERRVHDYPHNMSGGMRQRVMIAMALSRKPGLLIADEPTTALDVTIQSEILELMKAMREEEEGRGMSMLFVSHNLAVVADIADRVLVMYAGRVVEEADSATLFANPQHPYTRGLLASTPSGAKLAVSGSRPRLHAISGAPPGLHDRPHGCKFQSRCSLAISACSQSEPGLAPASGHSKHLVRCIRAGEAA